jgi:hypothetical protein
VDFDVASAVDTVTAAPHKRAGSLRVDVLDSDPKSFRRPTIVQAGNELATSCAVEKIIGTAA